MNNLISKVGYSLLIVAIFFTFAGCGSSDKDKSNPKLTGTTWVGKTSEFDITVNFISDSTGRWERSDTLGFDFTYVYASPDITLNTPYGDGTSSLTGTVEGDTMKLGDNEAPLEFTRK
ncbi:MAG: hypothetical protein LBO69_09605 [Ignavibacteria bacterium]|jgi:hypothetical protein|nr:hypothetical protein [Ignavibacteria bacterium]